MSIPQWIASRRCVKSRTFPQPRYFGGVQSQRKANVLLLKRLNVLRLEADTASAKVEELQTKVKTLEQENLSKEQEVTSLQHKNGLLEGEVEKLETAIKDHKKAADEGQQHGTQNETLQRRLQLLEEEAEDADKTLREANEKYDIPTYASEAASNKLSHLDLI